MPTVLRDGPYRLHFYPADRDEPPHVHVARDDKSAKIWLNPVVLARNDGYHKNELRQVIACVRTHSELLLRTWNEYFHH